MDDRNELFGDDFDDFDDMFDDESGGGDYKFDDDDFDIDGLDKLDFDDDNVIGDDDGGGPSRTFVILAGMMIVVFILALAFVILQSAGDEDQDPFDATSTAIAEANETTIAQINRQNTLDAESAATQVAIQVTEAVQMTEAAQTAFAEQTTQAGLEQVRQTQQAINATSTFIAQSSQAELQATADAQATANAQATQLAGEVEVGTPQPITLLDAQLTATALAEIYLGLTPTGNETPTREVVGPVDTGTGGPTVVSRPGQLPETGFLDENLSLLILAAFGLLGVIFASRRLRSLNSS